MLRFLIRRKSREVCGVERESHYTIDGDIKKLEEALTSGGFGEDLYEIHELIGVEVLEE